MPAQAPDVFSALQIRLRGAQIPALNGLRALAVSLVFLVHAEVTRQTGILGVEGFFVISGFLITWKLLEENEAKGTVSLRQFYWRRVLRIFPAFYFYWTFCIVQILIRGGSVPWPDAMAAFAYVSNYYQGLSSKPGAFMLHTWSLSVEEQFYLLWPALFIGFRQRLARLTRILAVLVTLVWVCRAVLSYLGPEWLLWYIFTAFEMRLDQLAIGCLLAITLRRRAFPEFWRFVCARSYSPLITIGLIALSEQFADNLRFRDAVLFITDPILCAVLLVQMVAFASTAPWKWLNTPIFNWLGTLSYSIYLYHELAIAAGKRFVSAVPQLQLPAMIILTLMIASASYYLIEKPFLRLKNRGILKPRMDSRLAKV